MIREEPVLFHRVIDPRREGADHPPGILLLHGRGADEQDLAGLAGALDPRLLIVSVRAPFRFEEGGGYTWFDMDQTGAPDMDMFHHSGQRLSRLIHHCLADYKIDPQRLFLLGFSMGTMMAYAVSLTTPRLFSGVIANSGFLPRTPGITWRWNELSGTRFFITHGTYDPVIPIGLGRETRDLFRQSNAEWVYREYPMGHEISTESLADQASWLTQQLNGIKD